MKLNHFPHSPTPWGIEKFDQTQTIINDAEERRVTLVNGTNQQSVATAAYIVECVNLVAAAQGADAFHPAFRHLMALREAVAELEAAAAVAG